MVVFPFCVFSKNEYGHGFRRMTPYLTRKSGDMKKVSCLLYDDKSGQHFIVNGYGYSRSKGIKILKKTNSPDQLRKKYFGYSFNNGWHFKPAPAFNK